MRKEIMGNQNATAIPEDAKVDNEISEKLGQENISSDDKKEQNEVNSTAEPQHTNEVSSDITLREANNPPDEPNPGLVHAIEQGNHEQSQSPSETRDQLKANEEERCDNGTQNDEQEQEKPSFNDNEVSLDSGLSQKCLPHISEPSEHIQEDMHNSELLLDKIEEHRKQASNGEEVHKEATHITEDECKQEGHDEVDLLGDLKPESDMVDAYHHSNQTEDKYNKLGNGDVKESSPTSSSVNNGPFSQVSQAYTTDINIVHVEENLDQSGFKEPSVFSDKIPEPRTSDIKEEIEDKFIAKEVQAHERRHESESNEHDQRHEGMSNGNEHQQVMAVNNDILEYSGSTAEAQAEEFKDSIDNFASLTCDRQEKNTEPVSSNGFKNKDDELVIKDLVLEIRPKQDVPEIEGFIFTNEPKSNGGQPATGFLLNKTVTNVVELSEDKGRKNEAMNENENGESQVQKCPSFNFELKNIETRESEANQTPLLFLGKPPMRSLSTPGNIVLLSTLSGSDRDGRDIQEKAIILERNDSEKSRTPLLKFDDEQEPKSSSTTKKQDMKEFSNGETRELSKSKQKQKAMSSFFSNCVCCAGVGELNADF